MSKNYTKGGLGMENSKITIQPEESYKVIRNSVLTAQTMSIGTGSFDIPIL